MEACKVTVADNKYYTEKGDRPPHQNNTFSIASKRVGLSLDN